MLSDLQPELAGWLSFNDFGLDRYYTDVVRYEGSVPGTISIGGTVFAHFMTAGNYCRPISGINHATSLLNKKHCSVCVTHSHLIDFSSQVRADGRRIPAVVAGCLIDPAHHHDWAGQQTQKTWWSGVVVLRNCDGQGAFDPSFISLDALKKEYGRAEAAANTQPAELRQGG